MIAILFEVQPQDGARQEYLDMIRDYGKYDRAQAPVDSKRVHDASAGADVHHVRSSGTRQR